MSVFSTSGTASAQTAARGQSLVAVGYWILNREAARKIGNSMNVVDRAGGAATPSSSDLDTIISLFS